MALAHHKHLLLFFLTFLFTNHSIIAVEGRTEYEQVCGACHGIDGKGGPGGQFPPLAESDWIHKDSSRLIQVMLHGLQGPIHVSGKQYNLMMPPQGGALTDTQIKSITNYVRGAWGNYLPEIDLEEVKRQRGLTVNQTEPWTEQQLDDLWPLPIEQGPLENLIATFYKGRFEMMPDFSQLEIHSEEEESGGYFDLKQTDLTDGYAVVWEAELEAPANGQYDFNLSSKGGARLFINDKEVVWIKGVESTHRRMTGNTELKKGKFSIKLEYFSNQGKGKIALWWNGPERPFQHLSTTRPPAQKATWKPIIIEAKEHPIIYRNFITGGSAKAIAIGYPEKINTAFSAETLGLQLLWQGPFVDAGKHWTDRGKGFQDPAGENIVQLIKHPAFATIDNNSTDWVKQWPKDWQKGLNPQFKGYKLDQKRRPEFIYEVGGVTFYDKSVITSPNTIKRSIKIVATHSSSTDLCMLLSKNKATMIDSHSFQIEDLMQVNIKPVEFASPSFTTQGSSLSLHLTPGLHHLEITYSWK